MRKIILLGDEPSIEDHWNTLLPLMVETEKNEYASEDKVEKEYSLSDYLEKESIEIGNTIDIYLNSLLNYQVSFDELTDSGNILNTGDVYNIYNEQRPSEPIYENILQSRVDSRYHNIIQTIKQTRQEISLVEEENDFL